MSRRLASVVGVLAASVLAMALFRGEAQPQCEAVPVQSGDAACAVPADCEGLVHIMCVGAWQCLQGACAYQCGVQEIGCHSDGDCPSGQHCSVSDGECLQDPNCQLCAVCYGHCKDDKPAGCWQNSDCDYGYYCAFLTNCGPQTNCVGAGTCEPYGDYGSCKGDGDCAKGYVCDPCGCTAGAQCFACIPDCMITASCSADADCPDGYACNITDPCGPPPGCHPGMECPAVCWPYGNCQPSGLPKCKKTGCSGQICSDQDVITTCEYLPQYACFQKYGNCGNFGTDGACAWEPTEDLVTCLGGGAVGG